MDRSFSEQKADRPICVLSSFRQLLGFFVWKRWEIVPPTGQFKKKKEKKSKKKKSLGFYFFFCVCVERSFTQRFPMC